MRQRWLAPALLALGMCACGGGDDAAWEEAVRVFRQGSDAWADSVELEAAARRGDPEAYKGALKRAEDALAYWQWAAATRADWPEARRNVERALLRMDALRERAGRSRPPPDKPEGDEETRDDPPLPPEKPVTADLPPAKVLGLFEVLRARELEKRRMRGAQRRARSADVERDW